EALSISLPRKVCARVLAAKVLGKGASSMAADWFRQEACNFATDLAADCMRRVRFSDRMPGGCMQRKIIQTRLPLPMTETTSTRWTPQLKSDIAMQNGMPGFHSETPTSRLILMMAPTLMTTTTISNLTAICFTIMRRIPLVHPFALRHLGRIVHRKDSMKTIPLR